MKPTGIFDRVIMAEAKAARLERLVIKQADSIAEMRDAILVMKTRLEIVEGRVNSVEWPEVEPIKLARRIASMAEIGATVAAAHLITLDEIRSNCRAIAISHPRQMAMLEMSQAGHSHSEIGRFFHKDHTTVMYGIRAARARVETSASCQ